MQFSRYTIVIVNKNFLPIISRLKQKLKTWENYTCINNTMVKVILRKMCFTF